MFTLVLFVYIQCLQFFVGGIMSCLRWFCLFTYSVSSSLQEGSCLVYVVFACLRIVSPVLCRRDHVLFTQFLFVYVQCLQFFVNGTNHLLLTLFLLVYVQSLQFFVGGIMSCLRCFCLFTYSVSSSLQEGSCLVYVVFVCLRIVSPVLCKWNKSCLAYVVFACLRIVSPVLCRRGHVLFTLFLLVYVQCLQFFVRGIMSCLCCFCLFMYSVSSSLQGGSCLAYVVFACFRKVSPVLCRRDHVLLTLFLLVYVQGLQFFVGGIMSCLRWFVCLRIVSPVLCRRDHVLFTLFLFVYVQSLQFFVGGIMSCLRCFCLFTYSVSSSLQEGS